MKNPIFKAILRSAPRVKRGGGWRRNARLVHLPSKDYGFMTRARYDQGFRLFKNRSS